MAEIDVQIIERNSARCLECDDEIESVHRHDFKYCKCGNIAVDGGKDYIRRLFANENWEDTSVSHWEKRQRSW